VHLLISLTAVMANLVGWDFKIPCAFVLLSGALAGHRLARATVPADSRMGVMRINCPELLLMFQTLESHDLSLSNTIGSRQPQGTYVRFFDLIPGFVIRTPPRLVTAKEMVAFASRYDPQWFHIGPLRAAQGRWKGLIASGWHTCVDGG
jgi:hypothetical protein